MQIHPYHQSRVSLGQIVSQIDTLDRFLRIIDQAAQLHIEAQSALNAVASLCFVKLHKQFREVIEILGVSQGIMLAEELIYPNEKGVYFFQRASWQRSLGRIFLVCYSCLRILKWIAKLEFIQLGRITRIVAGNLTYLRLITDCSYIFYRIFGIAEGIRTKTAWRVGVSAGKIIAVAASLAISAWKVQVAACTLGVIGLNLALDCYILNRRITHV